jgi:hypothetical protein
LFRAYVFRFTLLWIAAKIANASSAALLHLPPLAFRPWSEVVICLIELAVLVTFIRQSSEDILLGNAGLPLRIALFPFVLLHFVLSGVAALIA